MLTKWYPPLPNVLYGKVLVWQVLNIWSVTEFKRHFIVSKTLYMYCYLLDELRDSLEKINHGGYIPIYHLKISYTFSFGIWYLANLDCQLQYESKRVICTHIWNQNYFWICPGGQQDWCECVVAWKYKVAWKYSATTLWASIKTMQLWT